MLLVATGPLTNVALALAEEPRLPELLKGFAIMGGAFDHQGNVTPAAEANIWVDPDAAQAVFRGFAGVEEAKLPVCAGLDVTERVKLDRDGVDAMCAPAPDSPLAQFLQGAVLFYIEYYQRYGSSEGASMHDPLALAIAIDPSLARLQTTRVEVETEGTWTRGETVTDLRAIRRSPWPTGWMPEDNARVALDVDAPAFMTRLIERLRSLVEASRVRIEGPHPIVVVLGAINVDLVVSGAPLPGPGQTVSGGVFAEHHGGKGGNQAVAAARAIAHGHDAEHPRTPTPGRLDARRGRRRSAGRARARGAQSRGRPDRPRPRHRGRTHRRRAHRRRRGRREPDLGRARRERRTRPPRMSSTRSIRSGRTCCS